MLPVLVPLASVFGAIRIGVNPLPMRFIVEPLTLIRITIGVVNYALTASLALGPVSLVP